MSALLRRLAVRLAVGATLVLGVAGPAAAAAPGIGKFSNSESGVDPGASAACGFTVGFALVGTGRFQVFVDQSGNPRAFRSKRTCSEPSAGMA
jgi:hypothetical protein